MKSQQNKIVREKWHERVSRVLRSYMPDDIIETIHKTIIQTNEEHLSLTGYSVSFAPEYLITVNLAKQIKKLNDVGYVYMEWNIEDIIYSDNLKNLKHTRNGKCDICIVFNDNTNAIIEVKNTITQVGGKLKSIYKDIHRISDFVLNENELFNKGYVCFIVKARGEENALSKADKYISDMKNNFQKLFIYEDKKIFKEEKDSDMYLVSTVLRIQKK